MPRRVSGRVPIGRWRAALVAGVHRIFGRLGRFCSRAAGRGRRLVLAITFVLVVVAATGGGALYHWWTKTAPPGAAAIEVEVPEGASLRVAARRLQRAGLVANARAFELLARTLGGGQPIRFGTYAFPAGEGWGALLGKMQRGDVLTIPIVIPEGLPSILVAARLNAAPRLKGVVAPPPEGSILPATYRAKVGEDRAAVLRTMEQAMAATLDRLWRQRSPRALVQTKEEAIVLASIVEKETAVAAERRRVAGLYQNRLRLGMPLQADPTVIYPVTKGAPLGRAIRQSELDADNGYNTYRRPGLPVGPIANPGVASIEAVLDPEKNDYLYMVADGRGGHVFASDYRTHQENVRKWRLLRREKGF